MAEILPISKSEFLSLATEREPLSDVMYDEREWYADGPQTVIGVLLLDLTDQDWSYVVLTRDSEGVFRPADLKSSFADADAARTELLAIMRATA